MRIALAPVLGELLLTQPFVPRFHLRFACREKRMKQAVHDPAGEKPVETVESPRKTGHCYAKTPISRNFARRRRHELVAG